MHHHFDHAHSEAEDHPSCSPAPLMADPSPLAELGQDAAQLASLAADLRLHLARACDIATSSSALGDVLDQASEVSAGGGFSAVTHDLSDTSKSLEGHAATTVEAIHSCLRVITALGESMQVIERDLGGLVERATAISSSATEIERIAHQSHMLSLNARIEAARAGEAGAGFNVVAGEVGDLARRSSRLSSSITGEVAAIREGLERTTASFHDSREALDESREAVHSLESTATGISDQTGELGRVCRDVEAIAYGQVQLQDLLDRAGRHGAWVREAAGSLRPELEATSRTVDARWRAALPADERGLVDDLDRLGRAQLLGQHAEPRCENEPADDQHGEPAAGGRIGCELAGLIGSGGLGPRLRSPGVVQPDRRVRSHCLVQATAAEAVDLECAPVVLPRSAAQGGISAAPGWPWSCLLDSQRP